MKDNFSSQASCYAQFRPAYPEALYKQLIRLAPRKEIAWDCGCGNGQVAGALSHYFERVIATDISEKQIEHAIQEPNITYELRAAEKQRYIIIYDRSDNCGTGFTLV